MLTLLAAMLLAPGCGEIKLKGGSTDPAASVPEPLNLLLPSRLAIHPFTQTTVFENGMNGLHVRVQFFDSFGDPTKAFGDLRFELYSYSPYKQGKQGARLNVWDENVSEPHQNLVHWDSHTRSYEFRLASKHKLTQGRKFILIVVYTSRFTNRMTAETELSANDM